MYTYLSAFLTFREGFIYAEFFVRFAHLTATLTCATLVITHSRTSHSDFVLKFDQAVNQSLGTRRTARNVNIYGNYAVYAFKNVVTLFPVRATFSCARTHCDNPFRIRHLVIKSFE